MLFDTSNAGLYFKCCVILQMLCYTSNAYFKCCVILQMLCYTSNAGLYFKCCVILQMLGKMSNALLALYAYMKNMVKLFLLVVNFLDNLK